MGTSRSFRSPNTPRWQALNSAYEVGLPLERLRVILFAAGEETWADALAAPAVGSVVEALVDAYEQLAGRLSEAERPDNVISAVVRDARTALADEGFTPAISVTERAMRTVLVAGVQTEGPLSELDGPGAARSWETGRGAAPAELIQRYLGEVLSQYAKHVVSRDLPRLVGSERLPDVAEARHLTSDVAREAAQIADRLGVSERDPSELAENWSSLVFAAFALGKKPDQISDA